MHVELDVKWSLSIVVLLSFLAVAHEAPAQTVASLAPLPHARIDAQPITEMSGLVKSRRHPNLFWLHNDSGDEARLFAIDGDGRSILPTYSRFTYYGDAPEDGKQQWQGFTVLYAENRDWEDIAADERYLYVADTGNNANARRDLVIYMISEIDPTASTRSAVVRALPVVYPDQDAFPPKSRHFDSESLFVDAGKLYLLTKHRGGLLHRMAPGVKLYRLDSDYSDRDNILTLVDHHDTLTAATGAELSPDGQTLAVISYTDLWLFQRPASGDQWLSAPARHFPLDTDTFRQVEAITWIDDDTLLLGNEQRDLFRLVVSALPDTVP